MREEEERHKWMNFLQTGVLPEVTVKNYIQRVEVFYEKEAIKTGQKLIRNFLDASDWQELFIKDDISYTESRPEMVTLWKKAGLSHTQMTDLLTKVHTLLFKSVADGRLKIAGLSKIKEDMLKLAGVNRNLSAYLKIFCKDDESFDQFAFWFSNKIASFGTDIKNGKQLPQGAPTFSGSYIFYVKHDVPLDLFHAIFYFFKYLLLPQYANVDWEIQKIVAIPARTGYLDIISHYENNIKGWIGVKMSKKLVKHFVTNILGGPNSVHQDATFSSEWVEEKLGEIFYAELRHLQAPLRLQKQEVPVVNQDQHDMIAGNNPGFFEPDAAKFIADFLNHGGMLTRKEVSQKKIVDRCFGALTGMCSWLRKTNVDMWDIYFMVLILTGPEGLQGWDEKTSQILQYDGDLIFEPGTLEKLSSCVRFFVKNRIKTFG